jgi:glycosyltransferase involved in cell wall biosynthesis
MNSGVNVGSSASEFPFLVSIVMPVYNGRKFLDLAVKSVIEQTYSHWELVIIDDGSTDESFLCINKWAASDRRIKVYYHKGHANCGVSATRNLGIQHAQGAYVALLDCDDEWHPSKLEKQVCLLQKNPDVILIYSKAISVDEDGIELSKSRHQFDFPHFCGTALPETKDSIVVGMMNDSIWMPALTVVMNIQSVRKAGCFDETLKFQVEDHLLFTLMVASGPVYFMDEVLASYRVHKDSYTQTTQWRWSKFEYLDRLYERLPSAYHRAISSARTKLIVDGLVKSRASRAPAGMAKHLRGVAGLLLDKRVTAAEKVRLVSSVARGLVR